MFWLRTAVQLAFGAIFIMSIVGFVVMNQSVDSLGQSISDISLAAELRNGISGLRKYSMQLFNIPRGLVDPVWTETERRNMFYEAKNLSAFNEHLYLRMQHLTPELNELYTTPVVDMEEMAEPGTVTISSQTLWQAMNSLLSHAFLMLEVPLDQIGETEPHTFVRSQNACSFAF